MARDRDIRARKPSSNKIAVSKPLCTFNGHTCQGKNRTGDAEHWRIGGRLDLLKETMSCWLSPVERARHPVLDGDPEYTVKESAVKQKMSLCHFSGCLHLDASYLKGIDRDRRSSLRFRPDIHALSHNSQQRMELGPQLGGFDGEE